MRGKYPHHPRAHVAGRSQLLPRVGEPDRVVHAVVNESAEVDADEAEAPALDGEVTSDAANKRIPPRKDDHEFVEADHKRVRLGLDDVFEARLVAFRGDFEPVRAGLKFFEQCVPGQSGVSDPDITVLDLVARQPHGGAGAGVCIDAAKLRPERLPGQPDDLALDLFAPGRPQVAIVAGQLAVPRDDRRIPPHVGVDPVFRDEIALARRHKVVGLAESRVVLRGLPAKLVPSDAGDPVRDESLPTVPQAA